MSHLLSTARPRGRAALLTVLFLATAGASTPSAIAQGAAQQDNGALLLSVGESRVLNLSDNLSDVVIANPNVLDVHVRSQRQVYLIAKAPGETNIFITTRDGKMLYANAVRIGNNLTSMDQMLRIAMPDAAVNISTMNGMLLLTGTVAAPEDAAEAERLVQAFVGKDTTVVSRLRTATPLQVNLQVRIAEVNKNFTKSLGFNILNSINNGSGFIFGLGQGNPGSISYPNVTDPNTGKVFVDPVTGRAVTDTAYKFTYPTSGTTLARLATCSAWTGSARSTSPNSRPCRNARQSQPDGAFRRDGELPGRWRDPHPDRDQPRQRLGRVQAIWRQPGLHPDRARRWPHLDARPPRGLAARRQRRSEAQRLLDPPASRPAARKRRWNWARARAS